MAARYISFGPHQLHHSQIFYESLFSFGIVNLKPIVPGHVLFIPKRNVPRLQDLTHDELSDLFRSVQSSVPIIEGQYGAMSSNVAIQDGVYAGQSVPHIHVHILPRKPADFANSDDVYTHLEQQRLGEALVIPEERRPRTFAEMESEALILRTLFPLNQPRTLEELDTSAGMQTYDISFKHTTDWCDAGRVHFVQLKEIRE